MINNLSYLKFLSKNKNFYESDKPIIVDILLLISEYLESYEDKNISNILDNSTLLILMNSQNFHPKYLPYFKHLLDFNLEIIYLELLPAFQLTWIKYFPNYEWNFGKFGISNSMNFELPWIKYYQKHNLMDKLDLYSITKSNFADKSWTKDCPEFFKNKHTLFPEISKFKSLSSNTNSVFDGFKEFYRFKEYYMIENLDNFSILWLPYLVKNFNYEKLHYFLVEFLINTDLSKEARVIQRIRKSARTINKWVYNAYFNPSTPFRKKKLNRDFDKIN